MAIRERICVIGAPGTGKTYQWLNIAQALPKATFHVIDPDDGVERVRVAEFPDLKNINYYFTPSWFEDLKPIGDRRWEGGVDKAAQKILREHKEGDWIILEHMGAQWDMVQSAFTDEVFEKDIGKYFLERRKAQSPRSSRVEAFDGWKDWVVIKKLHNEDYIDKMCYRTKAHLYITSSFSMTTDRMASREDPELQEFYVGTRIRIDGEKRLPFKVHTILLFTGNKETGWKMSTFQKERGRRWLKGVSLNNLYVQYLGMVAGWPLRT